MEQLSFEDMLTTDYELIHCPFTQSYHWIRITSGFTPSQYTERIHFTLHGFDYLYEDENGKTQIINAFNGPVKTVTWEEVSCAG